MNEVNVSRARPPSAYAPRYLLREYPVVFNYSKDHCMLAAVAKRIALIRGETHGRSLLTTVFQEPFSQRTAKGYLNSFRAFKEVGKPLREIRSTLVSLKKPRRVFGGSLREPYVTDFNFEWLMRLKLRQETVGLYDFWIYAQKAFCVNLRTSSPLLIDCAERYAMRLCPESLSICAYCDTHSDYTGFSDVCKVRCGCLAEAAIEARR